MIRIGRPPKPAPETDSQSRLAYIEKRCQEVSRKTGSEEVRELAYLVGYVAVIVQKHLRADER